MRKPTPVTALTNAYAVTVLMRFESQIKADGDCWLWTGSKSDKGYGKMPIQHPDGYPTAIGAHRVSWLAHRGDIPAGLMLDHLCRNRLCVNPWHLDVVTGSVNNLRGISVRGRKRTTPTPKKWAAGFCKQGHDVTENQNVYYDMLGSREVRRCIVCAIEKLKSKQRAA